MRTLVAYVPVLHEGYRRFFETYEGPKELFILGPELITEFPWLAKEIRQLDPELMRTAIESLGIFERVEILDSARAKALNVKGKEVVVADEDISRDLAGRYFPEAAITYDPVFLRWDKHNALAEKPVVPEDRITKEEFHRSVMQRAKEESEKSSDIWRHVGAALALDGEVLSIAHNHHVPSAHTPYENGDPRNNFHKGEHIEVSSALHAEAALIAHAAKEGKALEGVDLYVTMFPCPPCAKLIAASGIKRVYCEGGYAVLDGQMVLDAAEVKVFFVE